jgi:hypothetical protein
VNSICRPSTFVASASPVTRRPTGVAARWRNVDGRADRALAGIGISADRIESGILHDHDHHGGGEHRRRNRVLEPVRKMLGLDEKAEGALGSEGIWPWLALSTVLGRSFYGAYGGSPGRPKPRGVKPA